MVPVGGAIRVYRRRGVFDESPACGPAQEHSAAAGADYSGEK